MSSSSSSTLDSVWARQRDRTGADRGEYVSRYTATLGTHDHDLHTSSGESKLDRNATATLSLADLTSTRMDSSSFERRMPRQSSPVPYTPARSWNAAIFNKSPSAAPVERSWNAAALAKPSKEPPTGVATTSPTAAPVVGAPKSLNPYATAWKPSSSPLSSSPCQTNSWEQHSPPAQPEAPSYNNGNEVLEENVQDIDPPASQQSWHEQLNQLAQQEARKRQSWDEQINQLAEQETQKQWQQQKQQNAHDSRAPQEQPWDSNKQPEQLADQWQQQKQQNTHDSRAPQEQPWDSNKQPKQPADQWQQPSTPRASYSPQQVQTPQSGQRTTAMHNTSQRPQRNAESEEVLNQRIERIRISNQAYMKKREIIEAEKANKFHKEPEESAARSSNIGDLEEEIRREREANAARKLKAAQLRQWDMGKQW